MSDGDRVVITGYAYWSKEKPHDPILWTAVITGELVREWRVDADTPENRERFKLH